MQDPEQRAPSFDRKVVVYVMTHHPKVAMTFIDNEIRGMERLGWTVVPVAMNSPAGEDLATEAARQQSARTVYLDQAGKGALVVRFLGLLARRPGPMLGLLRVAVGSAGADLGLVVRRLGHLLYAVAVIDAARHHGAHHLHAHFGLSPATIAWFAAEMAKATGAPVTWSFTIHGFHDFVDERLARLDLKAASADAVVCISDFTRAQLCRIAEPERWPRFAVIRCGLDLDRFATRDPRPLGEPPVVLTVARLSPEKGHVVLIDAASRLSSRGQPLRLRFVGSGPYEATLRAEAKRHGVTVEFLGELQPDAVREQLVRADLFCLPSFAEGVPVSIMEAMALGVPVVATNVGGVAELAIDGRTARTVAASDPASLADAIASVLEDSAARDQMTAAAGEVVRELHDNRTSVEHLDALFRACAEGAGTKGP